MAKAEVLAEVKKALGETGSYQDGPLNVFIDEVIGHMVDGGVPEAVANSSAAAGVIALGVTQLRFGNGVLSEYFYSRATQLVYKSSEGGDSGE